MINRNFLLKTLLHLSTSLLAIRNIKKSRVNAKRKHKFWVREIFRRRIQSGAFNTIVRELRLFDREYFFRFLRMSSERFEDLLSRVGPLIKKKKCRSREPISPAERLMVTLRYLASGDSQQTQSFYFRMGRSTVCQS